MSSGQAMLPKDLSTLSNHPTSTGTAPVVLVHKAIAYLAGVTSASKDVYTPLQITVSLIILADALRMPRVTELRSS